jgi:hypothetical protein
MRFAIYKMRRKPKGGIIGETARLAVMEVTMQGESDKEVSKVGAAMVGTEFLKIESLARLA